MSGKPAAVIGDLGTDHEGFPPTPITSGSSNVLFNGKPAATVGDSLVPHLKPNHPPHGRTVVTGSTTVFINGKPAAMTGSGISCGGVIIGSCANILIGDAPVLSSFSRFSPNTVASDTPHSSDGSASHSAANASESQGPTPGQVVSGNASGVTPSTLSTPVMSSDAGVTQQNDAHTRAVSQSTAASSIQSTNGQVVSQAQEPVFHIVRQPTSRADLIDQLYGHASAKPDSFERLNSGLGNHVLPGEMIVLGDPDGISCTRQESDLMQVADQVNAQVWALDADEAQFIVDNYDLLEMMTSNTQVGLGVGAVMVENQIKGIESTLRGIEQLHQDSYRKHGHLNSSDFFKQRQTLLRQLDFGLGSIARNGMSLDDNPRLKRALGVSTKSVVHNWKQAGIGELPGYASRYDKLSTGAKYAKGGGYVAVALDVGISGAKIKESCTYGDSQQCEIVKYQELGRITGSAGGGVLGTRAAAGCGLFAVTSVGVGGLACVIILGGIGAAVGSGYFGAKGEQAGDLVWKTVSDD